MDQSATSTIESTLGSIFARDTDLDGTSECARPIPTLIGDPLYAHSNITFHQLAVYISAPCLAVTTISALLLCWQHVRNYTAPQEQRQILRIVAMPVMYSLFNFLALCWYGTFQYVQPLAGLYESFAIVALFFLLLEWVCPEGTDREKYFDSLPFKGRKGEVIEGGSLAWFQRTWATVFQYPLITLIFTIIEIVTQYYGKYCSNSFAPKHAHLWLFLAGILVVAGALEATCKFAGRMKTEMTGTHKERAKIYSFLGIVFFQIIQGILFSILNGKIFTPTRKLTYNDINYGLPALLTCLEAVAFSTLFHWSYGAAEFRCRADRFLQDQRAPRLGVWRAVRDALDLSDVVNAVGVALGHAWRGLGAWGSGEAAKGKGSGSGSGSGMVGKAREVVGSLVAARRSGGSGSTLSSRAERGASPFDDRMGVDVGPAVPETVRDPSSLGRARTFNGEQALGFGCEGYYHSLRSSSVGSSGRGSFSRT